MNLNDEQQQYLRRLPGVDHLLGRVEDLPDFEGIPRRVLVRAVSRGKRRKGARHSHDGI